MAVGTTPSAYRRAGAGALGEPATSAVSAPIIRCGSATDADEPALPFIGVDLRVCFFGDSFTAGVGDEEALGWVGRVVAQARAGGFNITSYNLGVRRQTGAGIAARLDVEASPRLSDGESYGVVFSAGVNDTASEGGQPRLAATASLEALDSVIDLCRTRLWALLVVGPAPVADPSQNQRILALSQAFADNCDLRQVPFVGVAPLLACDRTWLSEVAAVDGSHPRSTGYGTLAELIQGPFNDWLKGIPRSG